MKTKVAYSVIGVILGLAIGYALFYERNSLTVQADLQSDGKATKLIELGE